MRVGRGARDERVGLELAGGKGRGREGGEGRTSVLFIPALLRLPPQPIYHHRYLCHSLLPALAAVFLKRNYVTMSQTMVENIGIARSTSLKIHKVQSRQFKSQTDPKIWAILVAVGVASPAALLNPPAAFYLSLSSARGGGRLNSHPDATDCSAPCGLAMNLVSLHGIHSTQYRSENKACQLLILAGLIHAVCMSSVVWYRRPAALFGFDQAGSERWMGVLNQNSDCTR